MFSLCSELGGCAEIIRFLILVIALGSRDWPRLSRRYCMSVGTYLGFATRELKRKERFMTSESKEMHICSFNSCVVK